MAKRLTYPERIWVLVCQDGDRLYYDTAEEAFHDAVGPKFSGCKIMRMRRDYSYQPRALGAGPPKGG